MGRNDLFGSGYAGLGRELLSLLLISLPLGRTVRSNFMTARRCTKTHTYYVYLTVKSPCRHSMPRTWLADNVAYVILILLSLGVDQVQRIDSTPPSHLTLVEQYVNLDAE